MSIGKALGRVGIALSVAAMSAAWVGCNRSAMAPKSETIAEEAAAAMLTWTRHNINIETPDSWCYGNDPSNCEKYGRLYTYEAAKSVCASIGEGWRLPTAKDWLVLIDYAGGASTAGTKLKSKSGWDGDGGGTDDYGFSGLPGGYRNSDGSFRKVGRYGHWWGKDEAAYIEEGAHYSEDASWVMNHVANRGASRHYSEDASVWIMNSDDGHVYDGLYNNNIAFSVRCVGSDGAVATDTRTDADAPAPQAAEPPTDSSFTDSRDGQRYRAVKIGENTWMAQNLNFETGTSWCNDCKKYGRLYDWKTALTACPQGWHLPTNSEWNDLSDAAGGDVAGRMLKSKEGWGEEYAGVSGNGRDAFGFSALPGGAYYAHSGIDIATGKKFFGSISDNVHFGYWWSAQEFHGNWATGRTLASANDYLGFHARGKDYGFSVRCVQDYRRDTASHSRSEDLTDSRDGQIYRTVKIGKQTWMAENLKFGDGAPWCYGNNDSNCVKYGRLYAWSAAMSACPSGWRLPDEADWAGLVKAAGGDEVAGKQLKSKEGWGKSGGGTDRFGFSALPGGGHNYVGYLEDAGQVGYFWSAGDPDSKSDGLAFGWSMYLGKELVHRNFYLKKSGFSVRCILGDVAASPVKKVAEAPQAAPRKKLAGESSFTDPRDKKVYRTVPIGHNTWMAENLDFKTGTSWCYRQNDSYCEKYGRLYAWETAAKACPSGWHLPSNGEWENLISAAGDATAGKALKSTAGWNDTGSGTDDLGFSALPGGHICVDCLDGSSSGERRYGDFWSATERDDGHAYYWKIHYGKDPVDHHTLSKWFGLSVRCVKN